MKRKDFIAMKIKTIKHIVKDGVYNIYKNKVMTIASVAIVAATIAILGVFSIIFVNLKANLDDLKKRPMIEVFCNENLNEEDIGQIESKILENKKVMNCKKVTKAEAYKEVQELFGDEILEGIGEDFLPISFRVNLHDSDDSEAFVNSIKDVPGVDKVDFSKVEVDFINKIVHVVNFISVVLVVVFLIASVGIISNTIKLTVGARKREIEIMKYVGAADVFVSGPFVVEGMVIGLIGAVIAFVIVGQGYNMLTNNIANSFSGIRVILLKDVINMGLVVFVLMGSCLGAVSGIFSVRKYLRGV